MSAKSVLGIATCIFGCGLLTAALVMNPPGEIHRSVIEAYVITLSYSALMFGIEFKIPKRDVTDADKKHKMEQHDPDGGRA